MVTNASDGKRSSSGRFEPGNLGGPGRPQLQTERAYLAIISEACPPEAWRQIVELAVKQAKNGQEKAREWLASFLVGKPVHAAPTLHGLAVEEETGTDPVASDAKERQRLRGHRTKRKKSYAKATRLHA